MLHNIIHISDIHIRTGDSIKSRYEEYIKVFDKLYESISHQPSIIDKSAVIVITGDLFHDKNKIGPSGLKIAVYLLQKLSSLAPVFIIRGNHDYRQDFPNERDMISGLVSYEIPYVTYLDTTGIHTYQNINFGLVAIQETLLFGSTSGIKGDLPDFPMPLAGSNYNIALFHGTITGTTLQNGTSSTIGGYPIDWIQGYDAILLGDIHLQQIKRACITENTSCNLPHTTICHTYKYDKEVPYGYSGSLIQQDFGETIKGHGYALWNLQDKVISVYHIKNSFGMINLHYNGTLDDIKVEHKQFIKPVTKFASLDKIIITNWFPDNLYIRIYGDDITNDILRLITLKIQTYGKNVLSITNKKIKKQVQDLLNTELKNKDISDILDINSTDKLIEYIHSQLATDNKTLKSNKWTQWLVHPEQLLISTTNIPKSLLTKLNSKIQMIGKDIQLYNGEFEKVASQSITTGTLTLHKLEWNWILSYKEGNYFNFDSDTHYISVLNAQNGYGKSNFLEIICISVFGQGFPSRFNKNYSSNIICDKKPDGAMASTLITFSLNGKMFAIQRNMRNHTTKRTIKFEDVILYSIIDDERTIVHQKINAVDAWVEQNIGKSDIYLMSAMLSQNSDKDFFFMDYAEQKRLLDKILSLDHIMSLQVLLKDTCAYYKLFIDLIESYTDGINSKKNVVDQKYIDELNECQIDLELVTKTKKELYSKWNMISTSTLSSISDITELESKITNLQNLIQTFPTECPNNISLRLQELTNLILMQTDAISKYHSFSDLNVDTASDSVDVDENKIQMFDLALKQHPYFKKKEYNIYEDVAIIRSKILKEYATAENVDALNLLISNFENWNKFQIQQFADTKIYFEDNSEIENLENKINELISVIRDNPNHITNVTKNLDRLRKQHKKLVKEKDLCSDRRPNKPTKTKEWLEHTKQRIHAFADMDVLLATKQFIQTSIQQIPIVCTNLLAVTRKITEHMTYLKECTNLPFNPECGACRLQPWRTKYDAVELELPSLQEEQNKLKKELESLKYSEMQSSNVQSLTPDTYSTYLKELGTVLQQICLNISETELYAVVSASWSEWDKWYAEYDAYKKHYDELNTEINEAEEEKTALQDALDKARFEMQRLRGKLEIIRTKKLEYEQYIIDLSSRTADYESAKKKVEWIWYNTLHNYRKYINIYLTHLIAQKTVWENEKRELELTLNSVLEREKHQKDLDIALKLLSVYPYWTQWNKLDSREKSLTLKCAELRVIIKGATGSSPENTQMLALLDSIKDDYSDISYISTAFNGYRTWLYSDSIGPVIQSRVNSVLELICDERPLFLECEWLDAIDTLSWFIRDGSSRVIIQKASGFQRFIVGIAMRVAINQIGLSRVRFTELFIDEGFTACDSDNLERVPAFLRGLLRFYKSIYLATHLEDLKSCADKHIYIQRCDNGLSLIQYGDAGLIRGMNESLAVAKKRGRPTKKSVVVVKV